MKKILVAALLSTAVTTPAFAAAASAESGLYAGVTVGRANTENPYLAAVENTGTATVASVLVGYQYTKNWGVEAFYTGAGKLAVTNPTTGTTSSLDADSLGINVVGTAPMSDAFSVYGKLGYANTKTNASSVPIGLSGDRRSGITGGLGGQFNVNKTTAIRVGVDSYELATTNGITPGSQEKFRSTVWSVGAIFRF